MLLSVAKQHLSWEKKSLHLTIKKGDLHMEITEEIFEQFKADLKKARTYQDLLEETGAIKKIIKASLEGMLDAEQFT